MQTAAVDSGYLRSPRAQLQVPTMHWVSAVLLAGTSDVSCGSDFMAVIVHLHILLPQVLPSLLCKLVVNLTINSSMKQSGCTTYQQPPECWQPFLSMSPHISSALFWLQPWQRWSLLPMASFETGLQCSRSEAQKDRAGAIQGTISAGVRPEWLWEWTQLQFFRKAHLSVASGQASLQY